jgi:hypothetical protein
MATVTATVFPATVAIVFDGERFPGNGCHRFRCPAMLLSSRDVASNTQ